MNSSFSCLSYRIVFPGILTFTFYPGISTEQSTSFLALFESLRLKILTQNRADARLAIAKNGSVFFLSSILRMIPYPI